MTELADIRTPAQPHLLLHCHFCSASPAAPTFARGMLVVACLLVFCIHKAAAGVRRSCPPLNNRRSTINVRYKALGCCRRRLLLPLSRPSKSTERIPNIAAVTPAVHRGISVAKDEISVPRFGFYLKTPLTFQEPSRCCRKAGVIMAFIFHDTSSFGGLAQQRLDVVNASSVLP